MRRKRVYLPMIPRNLHFPLPVITFQFQKYHWFPNPVDAIIFAWFQPLSLDRHCVLLVVVDAIVKSSIFLSNEYDWSGRNPFVRARLCSWEAFDLFHSFWVLLPKALDGTELCELVGCPYFCVWFGAAPLIKPKCASQMLLICERMLLSCNVVPSIRSVGGFTCANRD